MKAGERTETPCWGRRRAGILLHPTSLPAPHGIGDLGPHAHRFADFLVECRQGAWQILPLGPPGPGNSPYQPFSAFAGNPLLVSLELLAEEKVLTASELRGGSRLPARRVDYEAVKKFKEPRLALAYERFSRNRPKGRYAAYRRFCRRNAWWLDDFALFATLSSLHGGRPWTEWEKPLRLRDRAALDRWRRELASEIAREKFIQFEFFTEWRRLRARLNENDVKIIGDLPIFVAHNSADVWAHQELFDLDSRGRPRFVAGVPPDYFSATGQLWGNPLYRWEAMRRSGYRWWLDRLRWSLELFDLLRLDHFRGFENYWQVKAGSTTAVHGRWVPGPGAPFFARVREHLGRLPFIAEDLGILTEEVHALREKFALAGMRVLQFAFSGEAQENQYMPHNYTENCVAYTATHDNTTTIGWFTDLPSSFSTLSRRELERQRALARTYTGCDRCAPNWAFMRAVMTSVAGLVIVPLQDVIGLGSGARMNIPGSTGGNWEWRFCWGDLSRDIRRRLRQITEIAERDGSAR